MASTTCAFCERLTHMTPKWAETLALPGVRSGNVQTAGVTIMQGVAKCDNCGRVSMGVTTAPGRGATDVKMNFARSADESFEWFPRVGSSPDFPDVPEVIAGAAKEAHAAASISAPMAAILMARTVVEATAKDKGITTGRLVEKIDALAAADYIRESTREAAHEIRNLGNDMAHGDLEDRPSVEDAREVLALMNEVLNEVFQGPARTARIRAKRNGI